MPAMAPFEEGGNVAMRVEKAAHTGSSVTGSSSVSDFHHPGFIFPTNPALITSIDPLLCDAPGKTKRRIIK